MARLVVQEGTRVLPVEPLVELPVREAIRPLPVARLVQGAAARGVAEEEGLEGREAAGAVETSRSLVERTSRAPCSLSCKR